MEILWSLLLFILLAYFCAGAVSAQPRSPIAAARSKARFEKLKAAAKKEIELKKEIDRLEGRTKTSDPIKVGSRKELANKLKKLHKTVPPLNISPGAMCYSSGPAMLPDMEAFVCNACNKRALIKTNSLIHEGNKAKRLTQSIARLLPKMKFQLDMSYLCPTCNPLSGTKPKKDSLILNFCFAGEKQMRKVEVDLLDMTTLHAFLSGRDRIGRGQGKEEALQDHLPALERILGLSSRSGRRRRRRHR